MKISIIGMGHVGSTLAYTIATRGLAQELVLINRNVEKAKGDAADLIHTLAFTEHMMKITAGSMEASVQSDIVVLCVSTPWNTNFKSRYDYAPENIKIFKSILPDVIRYAPQANIIVVTNPVDVMTYVTLRLTSMSPKKVIGVGTLIDSARFRKYLSEAKGIHPDDIRAYVLGEHGDNQFAALSITYIGGEHLSVVDGEDILRQATFSGHDIMRGKGYSNFAVATATALIIESMYLDNMRTIPVSTLIDGYLGEYDVCLSLPAVIGRQGIVRTLHPELNEKEQALFRQCADMVRKKTEKLVAHI